MQRAPAKAEVVPTTVEELLAAARATLHRLTLAEALVPRNVLEWRLDPVIGGFQPWRAAGLPVEPSTDPMRV